MQRGAILADSQALPARSGTLRGRERLERWVELYQHRVARLAQRLMGWREDVDDIVQDVFLAALAFSEARGGDESPWPWLAAVTVNCCRKAMRRKALWRKLGLARWLGSLQETAQAADAAALEDETNRRVRECIASLPAKEREAVVLYYLEEFSVAEISGLLSVSANAVDVRLHRARAKLKSALGSLE